MDEKASSTHLLEALGKLLTLTTVLLPVIGVIARAAAFFPLEADPFQIAVAGSIAELSIAGLISVSPVLIIVMLAYFPLRRFAPKAHARYRAESSMRDVIRKQRDLMSELEAEKQQLTSAPGDESDYRGNDERRRMLQLKTRRLRAEAAAALEQASKAPVPWLFKSLPKGWSGVIWWVVLALALIASVGIVVSTPGWPGVVLLLIAMAAAGWSARGLLERTGRLSTMIPIMVPLLVLCAIASGLSGLVVGISTSEYRFSSALSNLATDKYTRLGESGDMVFLRDCRGNGKSVIMIQQGEIVTARIKPNQAPHPPSLWEVWRYNNDPRIGLGPC